MHDSYKPAICLVLCSQKVSYCWRHHINLNLLTAKSGGKQASMKCLATSNVHMRPEKAGTYHSLEVFSTFSFHHVLMRNKMWEEKARELFRRAIMLELPWQGFWGAERREPDTQVALIQTFIRVSTDIVI